jgi:hypothetical protein
MWDGLHAQLHYCPDDRRETVPKTLMVSHKLTWLIAVGDFIKDYPIQ